MKSGHERREGMAGFGVEVVVGAVSTIRDDRNEALVAVLLVVGKAHVSTCQFGDRVRQARRLRPARKKNVFSHRLWTFPWIHTGRAEQNKLGYPSFACSLQDVELDGDILVHEVCGASLVFDNPANTPSRQHDVLWPGFFKETCHARCILKIQLAARQRDDMAIALALQSPNHRRTDEARMTSDENPCVFFHSHFRTSHSAGRGRPG